MHRPFGSTTKHMQSSWRPYFQSKSESNIELSKHVDKLPTVLVFYKAIRDDGEQFSKISTTPYRRHRWLILPGRRCRDRCKTIQAKKIGFSTSPYVEGLKKCTVCEIYMRIDSKYCPCCNCLLRTRARSKKTKVFVAKILGNQGHRLYQPSRSVE